MSTQDDFVPKEYMTWLKNTQDNVPSEFSDAKEVRKYVTEVLKKELNKDFDEVFEEFEYEPIGVASIGQVHKARLRGSHKLVAVKLQLPDMERRFRADVGTIRMFCKLATPQFVPTFDEVERQFCTGIIDTAMNIIDIIRSTLLNCSY
jgi:predicted unusual protein kinase regulating ubiquinone biosynthesis (AarF/ABC1/UbiB family)